MNHLFFLMEFSIFNTFGFYCFTMYIKSAYASCSAFLLFSICTLILKLTIDNKRIKIQENSIRKWSLYSSKISLYNNLRHVIDYTSFCIGPQSSRHIVFIVHDSYATSCHHWSIFQPLFLHFLYIISLIP